MENFNLKKFLVENKLTTNSRMLKEEFAPSSSPVKGIEDATYSVQEAFKKAGVDMTRPVTVIHSEQSRPYQQDPTVLAKDLERLKQDFMEEYEEGDDFPVFYEYDNNTVLADEMPEGKNYKLAVVFFEAEDYSIVQ